MEIKRNKNGNQIVYQISGRLDSATAPSLTEDVNENLTEDIALTVCLKM